MKKKPATKPVKLPAQIKHIIPKLLEETKDKIVEKITSNLFGSDYVMIAPGWRNVEWDESLEVIKIIRFSNPEDIYNELKALHKYRPETIDMNRSSYEMSCTKYNENLCDCFLPDIDHEDCYCQVERRKHLEKSDYRGTKEYREWRTSVFERDDYMCQDCKWHGGNLNAHHKKTFKKYPKLRYELSNGVTLCVECHRKRHRKVK